MRGIEAKTRRKGHETPHLTTQIPAQGTPHSVNDSVNDSVTGDDARSLRAVAVENAETLTLPNIHPRGNDESLGNYIPPSARLQSDNHSHSGWGWLVGASRIHDAPMTTHCRVVIGADNAPPEGPLWGRIKGDIGSLRSLA